MPPFAPGTLSKLLDGGLSEAGGDIKSDSASLAFAVTMMMGGVKVRSNEVGFSSCFSNLEDNFAS